MGLGKRFKKAVKRVGKAVSKAVKQTERAVSDGSQKVLGEEGYKIAKGALTTFNPMYIGTTMATDTVKGDNPFKKLEERQTEAVANLQGKEAMLEAPPVYDDTPEGLDLYQANLRWKRRRREKLAMNAESHEKTNVLGGNETLGI